MRLAPTVIVVLVAASLTGCTPVQQQVEPPTRSSVMSPRSSTLSSVSPSQVSTVRQVGLAGPAGSGCLPTKGGVPAGALRARVGDVDGDRRADMEWARLAGSGVQFGFRTASGATIGARQDFAGGGTRSFVAGVLASGVAVALPSEGRSTNLWSFVACAFHPVSGRYDPAAAIGDGSFTFYSEDDGGAAGCLKGHLVGFHITTTRKDHETITAEHVAVTANGRHATTGGTTLVRRDAPVGTMAGFNKVLRYQQISCGTAKVLVPTAR